MRSKRTKIIIGIVTLCIFSCFTTIALAYVPPEPEVCPTSFNVEYGWHTGGNLDDVSTNNGVTMNFQQNSVMLDVVFDFPNEKCEYIIFDFTDSATWPYLWVVNIRVFYTTGNPKTLGGGRLPDGYYEFNLDNSRYIDEVLVEMVLCMGQYLYIDQLIAMKFD